MSDEILEQRFTVPSPARLNIGNIRGSVAVIPSDEEGVVVVQAVKRQGSGDFDRTHVIIRQDQDGSVTARVEFDQSNPLSNLINLSKPCKVDFTIRAPRLCNLNLDAVSCQIGVQGLEGDLAIKSVSGDVRLQDLRGNIRIDTVSGQVSAQNLAGEARVHTVSGRVQIDRSDLSALEGDVVSGGFSLQSPLSRGPYRFTSVSGDLRLRLPAQASFAIQYQHLSGKFHSELPATQRKQGGGREAFLVGNGGPEVTFKTTSGSLRLELDRSAGDLAAGDLASNVLPAQVPLPEAPPAQLPLEDPVAGDPEELRRQVLDRIERGEITVDEGIALLREI